jgi:hypothetical protein
MLINPLRTSYLKTRQSPLITTYLSVWLIIHVVVSKVGHYVFGCRGCRNRLWLPIGIVEQQADSVGLVCDQCKRVASYSLNINSPNYDRTGAWADAESVFNVMSPGAMRCEDRTCESPLVIFALSPLSMDFDERLAELRTWLWLDLKCPRGHKITRPGYL